MFVVALVVAIEIHEIGPVDRDSHDAVELIGGWSLETSRDIEHRLFRHAVCDRVRNVGHGGVGRLKRLEVVAVGERRIGIATRVAARAQTALRIGDDDGRDLRKERLEMSEAFAQLADGFRVVPIEVAQPLVQLIDHQLLRFEHL